MFSYLNPLPHLGKYKGPYKVGSTEFEIPVSEIGSSTTIPDPRVTTIKFRVFYPTTATATSKKSISWLPPPQKLWNQAYAQFMGMSERRATWLSSLPSILNHATIPAVQNAELLSRPESQQYPVVIFSHGLGGNFNTYSSLLGSLASCGVVCITPEHRDGSAPTALVKSSKTKVETMIPYQKFSHSPTAEVLNGRNAMLRIRLAELDMVYTAVKQLNSGKAFTNFADTVIGGEKTPEFRQCLDLQSARVTWAGHSFGSATMVQFVKSVYYHQEAPQTQPKTPDGEGWDTTPLYAPQSNSEIINQITPESPMFLLDLWTMPLRGPVTRWLWERPLPCYNRDSNQTLPNVISIMSAEFYKWPEMRNRTRAVLSENPNESSSMLQEAAPIGKSHTNTNSHSKSTSSTTAPAEEEFNEPVSPELPPLPTTPATEPESYRFPATLEPLPPSSSQFETSTRSPSPMPSTTNSQTQNQSQLKSKYPPSPAHLYLIRQSAHLSQSDFGPLFPNLTRYFMKALDPEKTIDLNVRGILAMMRGCGLDVGELTTTNGYSGDGVEKKHDRILEEGVVVERWERVSLFE